MSWIAAPDSRTHEPRLALSPLEMAAEPQRDLTCNLGGRINKDIYFIQKGRRLFVEEQRGSAFSSM